MTLRATTDAEDSRAALAAVRAQIAQIEADHRRTTGRDAFHLGRCGRTDLHAQLAGLYARAKTLTPTERRRP